MANELSDLLGIKLKRKVRNLAGESDIEGLPGFSVEVKNCSELRLAEWWRQTVAQCNGEDKPVLFYKVPRKGFRAVVDVSHIFGGVMTGNLDYTAEMSLLAFVMLYQEMLK
ncbi:MAG: hypothetical protein ABS69_10670 [Nitrosomonadales bacterium SCN 54-20]|nr:MAG: hypothetical protein ABS69_10670 [Nitrosomonadales bacterium SCN 54-20]